MEGQEQEKIEGRKGGRKTKKMTEKSEAKWIPKPSKMTKKESQ